MALKFGKTTREIFIERLSTAFFLLLTLAGEFALFAMVRHVPQAPVAMILALAVAWGSWQLVSRLLSGEGFTIRIVIPVRESRELFDTVFTALFAVNAVTFLYAIYSWWD